MLQIKIVGEFIDSYLYGDELFFFDSSGRLGAIELSSVSRRYARLTSSPAGISAALFADNKKIALYGEPVDGSVAAAGERIDVQGESSVSIGLEELEHRYLPYQLDSALLDVMITYGQLFAGLEDGLQLISLAREGKTSSPRKLLNKSCQMTSSKWGAVTASCLDEGTWSLLHDTAFGQASSQQPYHVSDQPSDRHEWSGGSLLTFDSPTSFEVRMAKIRRTKGERRLVEGFDLVPDPQIEFLPELSGGPTAGAFVSTSGGALLEIVDEYLYATPLSNWQGEIHSDSEPRLVAPVPGRIESVVEAEGGYVVEASQALHYVTSAGVELISMGETISLRSYPFSKRYRRIVTATGDYGLLLAVGLGDHPFPRWERTQAW